MSSQLITTRVWETLTAAARRAKRPAQVAVAYLGKGAANLLPLAPGSALVVDASEAAVKGGQTYPAELLRFHRSGVSIYRAQNLHAKIFAFGDAVFVGSPNASSHSAHVLQEAIVRVTDDRAVRAVRAFISGLCLEPLGPQELKRLQKLYRPPLFPVDVGRVRRKRADRYSALRVAHTREVTVSEELEREFDRGRKDAVNKRRHGRSFYIEELVWRNRSPFRTGELVMQVYKNSSGRLVSPPGHVIHTRKFKSNTLIYIEMPNDTWRPFSRLSPAVRKMLARGGEKNESTTSSLLAVWQT